MDYGAYLDAKERLLSWLSKDLEVRSKHPYIRESWDAKEPMADDIKYVIAFADHCHQELLK